MKARGWEIVDRVRHGERLVFDGTRAVVIFVPGGALPYAVYLFFDCQTVPVLFDAVPKNIIHGFF